MSIAEEHAGAGRNRSGSGVRQRQAQVGVRLTDEEYAALKAAADNRGLTPATVLRLAFIQMQDRECWCPSTLNYTVSNVPGDTVPVCNPARPMGPISQTTWGGAARISVMETHHNRLG